MNTKKTIRDEDTSMGIALKFAAKFQAHYPKKPIVPMVEELAKDLVASHISELKAEKEKLEDEQPELEESQDKLWMNVIILVGQNIDRQGPSKIIQQLEEQFTITRRK